MGRGRATESEMPKLILINPAMRMLGYSIITPRWLFVMAQATPGDLIDDLVLVDEALEEFNPDIERVVLMKYSSL